MASKLTPAQHAELNKLCDAASALRIKHAEALKQHNSNRLQLALLKGQKEAAAKAYVFAYRKAGLNRQSAWQAYRVSQGNCRLCGKPALPNSNHCAKHDKMIRNSFKKK
jgi:hypothetical protein